jgi:hypothetical protein
MASAKNFINSTLDMIRKSSSIAVLLMKKSLVERERRGMFQHLGELTYALYKTNKIKDESIEPLVGKIDGINRALRDTSTEIDSYVSKEIHPHHNA